MDPESQAVHVPPPVGLGGTPQELPKTLSPRASTSTLHDKSPSAETDAGSDTTLIPDPASAQPDAQPAAEPIGLEPAYGDTQQDLGEEVRFSVELTRIDRLDDTFSMDIRRLKGNLRSYMFLYNAVRE